MKSHLIQLGDIAIIPETIACIEPLELDAQHGCKLHLSIPPHQIDTNLGLKEIMDILNSEKTVESVPEMPNCLNEELASACHQFIESAHCNAEVAVNFVNHLRSIMRRSTLVPEIPSDHQQHVDLHLKAHESISDHEHNPDNVPPEKIPAGYRLARRSEVDVEREIMGLVWSPKLEGFNPVETYLTNPRYTFIIPINP